MGIGGKKLRTQTKVISQILGGLSAEGSREALE